MTFGEKVKGRRTELGYTQKELGEKIGVTYAVVLSYEKDRSRPRTREGYQRLAEALGVGINYLLSEEEAFVAEANEEYGSRGSKQAKELVEEVSGLFAGGELAEEDKDEMMRAIMDAYWIAKEKSRKKYTPKKYRNNIAEDAEE